MKKFVSSKRIQAIFPTDQEIILSKSHICGCCLTMIQLCPSPEQIAHSLNHMLLRPLMHMTAMTIISMSQQSLFKCKEKIER